MKLMDAQRDFFVEKTDVSLLNMKKELQSQITLANEAKFSKTLELIAEETEKTRKLIEEQMKIDPLTPERLELIKCEIRTELEEEFAKRSPLLRKQL